MICSDGFKDFMKMLGKTAVLFCVLGLAGFGVVSCSNDEDGCNHVYGEWVVNQEPDADHIGKKQRNCSKCNHSDVVEDASKFVSHKFIAGGNWIADENGIFLPDLNDGNEEDGIVNGVECSFNKDARALGNKHYGKKHIHYNNSKLRKHQVYWDSDNDGIFNGDADHLNDFVNCD